MLLTQEEFRQRQGKNKLRIAFVGMSNIGKSFRSNQMAKKFGFERIGVDDEIQKELQFKNMKEMAKWMGYPYEPQYPQSAKDFLELEEKKTTTLFSRKKNTILDTTGSVIYTSDEVHQFLKNNYFIVHFSCPEKILERMKKSFLKNPKPVLWGDAYQKNEDETEKEALLRCYPKLLEEREKKYAELADITIDGSISRDDSHSYPLPRFFGYLRSCLPVKK